MLPLTLHTDRLVLDQPHDGDVDTITEYCQDPLFEHFLTVPWPYERSHAIGFVNSLVPEWWASSIESTWALRFASGGPLLGVVSFRLQTHDVGFWLGAPHRGLGYMPEAVSRVADWAFDEAIPGLDAVRWECIAGNLASARVARKTGFRFAGSGPSALPVRDGSHPLSWRGTLAAGTRSVHEGWPAEVTSS